ncbi:MAG: N-acetylmuramoyl-L-alanine amidase, partial [Terrimicrobiaceae bacterium]
MKRARDRRHIFAIARSLRGAVFVVICALAGCISPYKRGAGKFDTVIIDAGHGGHDRGGRAISGSPEKALALDTARRLAAILRRKGFRVIETRTHDVFVPLGSRVASSNSARNSIFVSIHYN